MKYYIKFKNSNVFFNPETKRFTSYVSRVKSFDTIEEAKKVLEEEFENTRGINCNDPELYKKRWMDQFEIVKIQSN